MAVTGAMHIHAAVSVGGSSSSAFIYARPEPSFALFRRGEGGFSWRKANILKKVWEDRSVDTDKRACWGPVRLRCRLPPIEARGRVGRGPPGIASRRWLRNLAGGAMMEEAVMMENPETPDRQPKSSAII